MTPRKFDEIVPDAMSELTRMIEKGERERETRKARTVPGDRGAIRDKRKRARQLDLTLNK